MPPNSYRQGSANRALLVFLVTVALFGWLAWLAFRDASPRSTTAAPHAEPLVVHCAASLKPALEAIARDFERECRIPVQLQFGPSQALLAGIDVTRRGDLFIPADTSYIEFARKKNLAAELFPVAGMRAVIAVAPGNPRGIRALSHLLRPDVKFGQANPDTAAIGKLIRESLAPAGLWEPLTRAARVSKPTVNEVANDVQLGTLDATFVWDVVASQYRLEGVRTPELDAVQADVAAIVLTCSSRPQAALRFARFLSASDRGLRHWRDLGYTPKPGDPWEDHPEIQLFAGAMLRPAIEATLNEFERREGVRVIRVYNGCGILVAEMKTGRIPDAYFACDTQFMRQVQDAFLDARLLARNPVMIIVPKGNPREILRLEDLARPGLRIGVGHEQQSALGALTRQLLLASGHYQAIATNVAVQSATGDFLINQLRTGSLDAVLAYRSNAQAASGDLDALPISLPEAIATQPLAIGRNTRHPQLARRLAAALCSEVSKTRFQAAGFDWNSRPTTGTKGL